MKELGISSLIRRKKYRAYRGEQGRTCNNLLKRQFYADCCGQLKLATALEFFQYRFSDSFGGNP
ncbi:hypothetical protein OSL32_24095, partial [Escherichia coli]|nr:hypothetical protein [Escherichia coli]